jgi:hypothetical protein
MSNRSKAALFDHLVGGHEQFVQSDQRPHSTNENDIFFRTSSYGFGETRVVRLALLTFTALSGLRSCGVMITKFSGHAFTFRSSPTVFADTPMLGSTSTRILAGKPPRAIWSAAVFLGLYRMSAAFTSPYRLEAA